MRDTFITRTLSVLFVGAVVAGCGGGGGGGGGGGAPPSNETGEVTLAVTDAPADEIDTFEVDIVGFRFEKANGASVEVLPQKARVDFAELVTVSEVVAGATLPVGDYPRAFMTLDFSTAAVRIAGNPGLASLKDSRGAPLAGRQEIEIVFPGGGFVIGPGKGYFAQVDFDLDQSLQVDVPANTVTVSSIVFAEFDPQLVKDARVPGLASGFQGTGFSLDVRIALGLISRGTLAITTDAMTVFDLDGQCLQGQAGYDALKLKGDGTLLAIDGRVNALTRTLAAKRVVLLPQDLDEVEGLVVARSGGAGADATLTLRGVSVRRAAGSVTFNDLVTLQTSFANTKVNKRAVAQNTLSTDAINVGQRILAYGRFAGSTLDLTQPNAGFVRLVETGIGGAVVQTPGGGRMVLDVTRIGARPIAAFDFSIDGASIADASSLSIDVSALGTSLQAGAPVWVRGFFAPVTAADSDADFKADTVIDRTNAGSLLAVTWLVANAQPIAARSGAEATIDISQSTWAHVDQGLIVPQKLTTNPTVAGQSNGFYAILRGWKLTLFRDYASYLTALEAELGSGARAFHHRAFGRWDASANRMTAERGVTVLFF